MVKTGLILMAIAALTVFVACDMLPANITPSQGGDASEKGRVVYTVTDAAADMGAVQEVTIHVSEVRAYSETDGWTTISSTPRSYDLLELKARGEHALLADVQLDPGTYSIVRIEIDEVVVVDNEGRKNSYIPSNTMELETEARVFTGEATIVSLDFLVDKSLHVSEEEEYVFAPVVMVESRSRADVIVNTNNRVSIVGGVVNSNSEQGMDLDGNVGVGVRVPANVNISVDTSGVFNTVVNRVSGGVNIDSETNVGIY